MITLLVLNYMVAVVIYFVKDSIVKFVSLPSHIAGISIFPFSFIKKSHKDNSEYVERILVHERIHFHQQRKWVLIGGLVGFLSWYFAYVFLLPAVYNPFRWKWEYLAFRDGDKYEHDHIVKVLSSGTYGFLKERLHKIPNDG